MLTDLVLKLLQVLLGEHNTDVANEHIEEAGPLVVAGPLDVVTQAALHHGVLTHEDDGLRAESRADALELLGAHMVSVHQESLVKGLQEIAQLGVIRLLLGLTGHNLRHDYCLFLEPIRPTAVRREAL